MSALAECFASAAQQAAADTTQARRRDDVIAVVAVCLALGQERVYAISQHSPRFIADTIIAAIDGGTDPISIAAAVAAVLEGASLTPELLAQLEEDASNFPGRFESRRGDDSDSVCYIDREGEEHEIMPDIEVDEVADPIARMLNAVPTLIDAAKTLAAIRARTAEEGLPSRFILAKIKEVLNGGT